MSNGSRLDGNHKKSKKAPLSQKGLLTRNNNQKQQLDKELII
jgi:hypothetical protein